ncbi:hypothetical protein IQ249_18610 [Lusitaniella coriacea LEGE 07157]|uniref:Uncharacterized protein n=1 Tax=Lusitaniella coriacea LEGE 07157 TaxID=945747 RepID=A0A8J7IWB7_9CYAN|nr:hypothetical protein [Lusitaniella coriacea]MBE9117913.1 hypothetical protein [Lusitaniella coriacea LEGE 07157]
MSIYYEFALECYLIQNIDREVINILTYMTRSEEYEFEKPKIDYSLFQEGSDYKKIVEIEGNEFTVIQSEWRTILTNYPREGEQYLPGKFGSAFNNNNELSFRKLLRDDEFDNIWWLLLPWLASISETQGFVGYYRSDLDDFPNLIYFFEHEFHIYNVIPKHHIQDWISDKPKNLICLRECALSQVVKQELLRQANTRKISLEEYIMSVVTQNWISESELSIT